MRDSFPHNLFNLNDENLINSEELEAISQFEAALEEAKGLYGLRTRTKTRTTLPPARLPVRQTAPRLSNYEFGFGPLSSIREQSTSLSGSTDRGLRDSFDDAGLTNHNSDSLNSGRLTERTAFPGLQSRSLSPGRFYDWLLKSSFLSNMRIAPGANFTVLLPTDTAIAALPATYVNDLESNATKLREVLFYHIIPESIGVDGLLSEDMIPTLLRKKDIRVTRGSTNDLIMMSGAGIVSERKDLELDNGKVRFIQIDRVLMPPRGTLYDLISDAPGLSIFKGLVDYTGLKQELERDANIINGLTLFVPTDTAFAQVNHAAASQLTRDASAARSFLLNHFTRPVIFASAIPAGTGITTRSLGSGSELRLQRPHRDLVRVNGITVSFADVLATNGVLHVIDQVLL